ncbi:MAG: MucBP domain-containing protein [Liquorilactobacillus satsumensis]|uniref:MucBP domain-containing protein n=1 Tax=Lactobacillaceae TaxID=33958 RepID=UPI0039EA9DA5
MKRIRKIIIIFMTMILLLPVGDLQALISADSLPKQVHHNIEVTASNFKQNFSFFGNASYNQADGVTTLTPNQSFQVGYAALNQQINFDADWTLNAQINMGEVDQKSNAGGDGIGFAFHPNAPGTLGLAGAHVGIGGLKDVLMGFKFDNYINAAHVAKPTDQGISKLSWDKDDKKYYGTFVSTGDDAIAHNIKSSEQQLSADDLDNQFHDFTINYVAKTRVMTVTYASHEGLKTWQTTLQQVDPDKGYSFVMTASTGGSYAQQSFKIQRFIYNDTKTIQVPGGHVTVNYLDQNTKKPIHPATTQSGYDNIGYTIKTPALAGYQYFKKDGNLTGSFSAKSNPVVNLYYKKQSAVTVNAIDQQGKVLNTKTLTGLQGDAYQYIAPTIPHFSIKNKQQSTVSGNFGSQSSIITIPYLAQTSVTAHYVDQNGKKLLPDSQQTGLYGQKYTMNAPKIAGYQLKDNQQTGTFGDTDQILTFKYGKTATTTVSFQDAITKKVLQVNQSQTGLFSDHYQFNSPLLAGYQLQDPNQSVLSGLFGLSDQQLIVNYLRQTSLIIDYVDSKGHKIAKTHEQTGLQNQSYTVSSPQLAGYQLKTLQQSTVVGRYGVSDQKVTVPYRKITTVTVNYVDQNNKTLKTNQVTGLEGDAYLIKTPTIGGYQLKDPHQTTTAGHYTLNNQTLTVPLLKQTQLTINYIDQSGKAIKKSTHTVGLYDQDYTVIAPTIKGYVPRIVSHKGSFNDRNQTIVCQYDQLSHVTVKYIDQITHQQLVAAFEATQKQGTPFKLPAPKINNYVLIDNKKNPLTGSYGLFDQSFILAYLKQTTIKVNYVNQQHQQIAKSKTVIGLQGKQIAIASPNVKGYQLANSKQAKVTRTFGRDNQTMTVAYRHRVQVAIQYVNQKGQHIRATQVLKGVEGQSYRSSVPNIKGYRISNQKTKAVIGKFGNKNQTIVVHYQTVNVPKKSRAKPRPKAKPVRRHAVTHHVVRQQVTSRPAKQSSSKPRYKTVKIKPKDRIERKRVTKKHTKHYTEHKSKTTRSVTYSRVTKLVHHHKTVTEKHRQNVFVRIAVKIKNFFKHPWQHLKHLFKTVFKTVKRVVTKVVHKVVHWVTTAVRYVKHVVTRVIHYVVHKTKTFFTHTIKVIHHHVAPIIKRVLIKAPKPIRRAVHVVNHLAKKTVAVVKKTLRAGSRFVKGLKDSLVGQAKGIVHVGKKIVKAGVTVTKAALGNKKAQKQVKKAYKATVKGVK